MQGYRQRGGHTEREAGNETGGNNQAIDEIVHSIAHQNEIGERFHFGSRGVLVTPLEKLLQHEKYGETQEQV